ncbi:MAG TPA: PDZ domain-containing protein [Candidatus Saccharimonadales bacterium]|jgi:serine protease Do|nr:PDZ domain-containing protein [Candidatus Saccharimonadales bacterium]
MKKNILWVSGGIAVLGVALLAIPGRSAALQEQDDTSPTIRVQQLPKVRELRRVQIDGDRVSQDVERALEQSGGVLADVEPLLDSETDQITVFDGGDGPSWLGVETHEVTAENAKELKLSAERGVVVAGVTKDSPAAKAGLKENDVITEVNGQRVEGEAQFRRMIHEIPAGRSAQLTVWRDGRSQTLSATLGKTEERHNTWMNATPGTFAFRMPDVQIPEMPSMDFGGEMALLPGGRPRLGIDAEDIGGQLGSFFGAPDGEGILVRSVNSGSPAEKAGLKAGDVITTFNGDRVRSLGDLRQKLAGQNDAKTAKIGVLRNKAEVSLTVELPERAPKGRHKIMQRTNI